MNQPIHQQLSQLRVRYGCRQKDIGAALGVHERTVTRWENGRRGISVRHADAYARFLHHQLVATRDGIIVGTVIRLLPALPKLRRGRRITQADLGCRVYASEIAVTKLEERIRNGGQILLPTAEWYLAGFDYQVGLVPASALERAA